MSNRSPHHLSEALRSFLRSRFDLSADKASEEEVVDNIRKGVEFKGTNLWVLIFATFVRFAGTQRQLDGRYHRSHADLAADGADHGHGTVRRDQRFRVAETLAAQSSVSWCWPAFSPRRSTFFISPLSGAQSELLARTTPTTYDVLIAFFGGLAGIVAQSRKGPYVYGHPRRSHRYGADAAAARPDSD